jgi:hypothetical protein
MTLNHSSELNATLSGKFIYRPTAMTDHDYKDRLAAAMAEDVTPWQLASHLGMSYQGVRKVLDGKSGAFNAVNNSKAAQFLNVNPDWLATGEGVMRVKAASAPVAIAALAESLRQIEPDKREQVGVLLQEMVRDPDGPWPTWLAQLLLPKKTHSGRVPSHFGRQVSIFSPG